jgi:hypothetical protein
MALTLTRFTPPSDAFALAGNRHKQTTNELFEMEASAFTIAAMACYEAFTATGR